MKILLVASMVPRRSGSGAIPVLLYAELVGLSQKHDVALIAAQGDEPGEVEAVAELRAAGLKVALEIVDRRQPPPGLRRWRRRWRLAWTWLRGAWPWRTVWYADPAIQARLDQVAGAEEFDVIAVEDNAFSVLRLPAAVPAVLTQIEVVRAGDADGHSSGPAAWPRSIMRRLDQARWPEFQREAWKRFQFVQVYSPGDAEAVAEMAPGLESRVRVNPFGVVLPPAAADPSRELADTILFVGHFAHLPNRDAAIWLAREILPAVQARHAPARLRLVGTAPPREVLDLAGGAVEVIPDAPSVEDHLEAAAVVMAPVRSGGGMRMKVLQALAAGKAVVTTSLGADGYLEFDPDPPLVIADGRDAIADATALLLEDTPARHDLGRRARVFAARHYSPEAWAQRLEGVYQEAREARMEVARG